MTQLIFVAALLLLLSTGVLGCAKNNMRAEPYEHFIWDGWSEI